MYLLPAIFWLRDHLRYVGLGEEVAVLSLCFVLAIGWIWAIREARALRTANSALRDDLSEVTKALEHEMKWRFATEAFQDRVAAEAGDLAAKSTRELQKILAGENFGVSERAYLEEQPNLAAGDKDGA
jgi:hypothetical protein